MELAKRKIMSSNDEKNSVNDKRDGGGQGQKRNLDSESCQVGLPSHKRQRTTTKSIMTVDLTNKDDDNDIHNNVNVNPILREFLQNNSNIRPQNIQIKNQLNHTSLVIILCFFYFTTNVCFLSFFVWMLCCFVCVCFVYCDFGFTTIEFCFVWCSFVDCFLAFFLMYFCLCIVVAIISVVICVVICYFLFCRVLGTTHILCCWIDTYNITQHL